MMPPTSIDGTDITGATIDGTDVTEITVDGDTVFTAGLPDSADILVDYDVSATSSTNSIPDTTGNQPDATGDTYTTTTANGVRTSIEFGTANTNLNVFTMYIQSSGFTHRVNSVDTFSGLNTTNTNADFTEIYFGSYSGGAGNRSDADLGRWIMYDGDKRSIQSQVESFLAGLYGISI